jgi:hypothetical protein
MAMIDFEDRMPAPPMGIGERVFLGVLIALQAWGVYAAAVGGNQAVAELFQ